MDAPFQYSENLIESLQFYEGDPIAYCEDILNVTLDTWQKEASIALVEDHFVAIKAGSGVGKSFWASLMTMWFLGTKPFSKVPTTAPSQHQLQDILWAEHHKNISRNDFLSSQLKWTASKVQNKLYGPEWYAVARTARVSPDGKVAEGLQGFHCFSQDTQILTYGGWKLFSDLKKHDEVLTMNPDTNEASYQQPTEILEYDYEGPMYRVRHQNLDFCVTPNHQMLYKVRSHGKLSGWKKDEIQDIFYQHWYIQNTFKWNGIDDEVFELPGFIAKKKDYSPKKIKMSLWMYFLGFYFAEGHSTKNGYQVIIDQKDELILHLMDNLAMEMDFRVSIYPGEGADRVAINSQQLNSYLKNYGNKSINKYVPQFVKNASSEYIRIFLDGYLHGDGYTNQKGQNIYYTSSPRLADDLQELLFKVGGKASVRMYTPEQNGPGSFIRDQFVKTKHNRYRIAEYVDSDAYLTIRKNNLEQIPYNGKVYCVNVPPHHTVFTRRNGFCMWSGNSEENLLYVCDEASGIPDEIYPAVEGALTGKKAYAILISNPTRLSGYFYSLFHDPKLRGLYRLFSVSCLDSAYVEERYLKMMLAKYGENHPIYQIKVLGEFPKSDSTLLFAPEDIQKFENNDHTVAVYTGMPIEFGVDIGRSENRSICCIRQGEKILKFEEKYLTGGMVDTIEITQWILELMHAYTPQAVKIDAIGLGAGPYDNLKSLYPKIIMPVIGNAAAVDQHRLRYVNLRAQGFWNLTMLLPGLYCPEVPERLITELGNLHYTQPNQKILIESKKDFVANSGLQSPDYLDALMYAYMDEEICQDKFFRIVAPISLAGTLDGLEKKSPLDINQPIDMIENGGKWSQMNA